MNPAYASQWPDFIAESPFHSIMLGLLGMIAFSVIWLMTRRMLFGFLTLVCLLGIIVAVVVERNLVTDREQISQTIDQLATAVRNNNGAELLQSISDQSPHVEQAARNELARFTIEYCSVTWKDDPKIDWTAKPPQATVRFTAFIRAHQKEADQISGADIVGVELVMNKEQDGLWRVVDYSLYNPRGGLARSY